MSSIGRLYQQAHDRLCGRRPHQSLWHFQWLAVKDLRRDLRGLLRSRGGAVRDVGCGDKPYRTWFGDTSRYVGLDVAPGPHVDVVVDAGASAWALPAESFDTILCTQVVEHAGSMALLAEMWRVARPGATCVVSVPFIYNEHGAPHDFLRLSAHGLRRMAVDAGWEVQELRLQGGVGSTLGVLLLNWVDTVLNGNKATRLAKGLLLPATLLLALLVNCLGAAWDRLDRTRSFYGNVLLVARKP